MLIIVDIKGDVMDKLKYNKVLFIVSFLIYAILLIWVVVFKWINYNSVIISINNFRELDLTSRYDACFEWFFYFDIKDLFLNIILLFPLGIYYLMFLKRKYLIIPIGIVLTLFFEISQFFTCVGMLNVYDIIGNIIGVGLGYIFYLLLKRIYTDKIINIINITVIVLLTPVVIYAIYMSIKNIGVYF